MAAIRAPRRYEPVLLEERRPRGNDPRGPLRGGPERSAHDPRRKPRGGLCGGPARSAKEPQTPSKKTTQQRTKREEAGEAGVKTKPIIITVEETWEKKKERRWGRLSRTNALRAGRYWEDMDRNVKVFLDKNGERKEVDVEKRIERGKPRFLFNEKPTHPHEDQERKDADRSNSAEELPGVDEVPADQIQTERMVWLVEKVTSLQKESEEKERRIQELEAQTALLLRAS